MDSVVSQFNITYNIEQDRLLLRVGISDNSEVLLWLTRRIVKLWWPLLQEASAANEAEMTPSTDDPLKKHIAREFAREAAEQQLDFSAPYIEARENRLRNPILIKNLRIVYAERKPSAFEFEALNGQVVKINLTTQIILAFIKMLVYLKNDTGWDLNLSDEIDLPRGVNPLSVH